MIYISSRIIFEEMLNIITINPVLGLCGANLGLESFIYYLGSFFEEILNMMEVKINIAYNMCFFQNGMELEGMNGMTLPDLDDLYVIICEMPCFADAVTIPFLVIVIKYAIAKAVNQI
jgi:hypothetical protein